MKKLLLLLLILTGCSNYKLSEETKKENRKRVSEKIVVVGAMAAFSIQMKVIADKQNKIK